VEVRNNLGLGHYKHSSEPGRGYRNGALEGRLKAAEACDQSGLLQKAVYSSVAENFRAKGQISPIYEGEHNSR
jgi:hypothetical protein